MLSLANTVVGTVDAAVLSIHAIGRGYAHATGMRDKHGVKQTDRMLSNGWWLGLGQWNDAAVCSVLNPFHAQCTPNGDDLAGVDRAEIPPDGTNPANWVGLDFSATAPAMQSDATGAVMGTTGAWTMATNTGSLAGYVGNVPVLKVQCGTFGGQLVNCLP